MKTATGWYGELSFDRDYTACCVETTGELHPKSFFEALHNALLNAAVLSLTDKYSANFMPKTVTGQLPKTVSTLYDTNLHHVRIEDVLSYYRCVRSGQVRFMSSETKQQAMTPLRFKMQAGTATTSKFHAACHKSKQEPSISLLKRICTQSHQHK